MSQLAMELDELAVELGFENYEAARVYGYTFAQGCDGTVILQKTIVAEQNDAHKAILKERDELIEDLKRLVTRSEYDRRTKIRAIEFLRTEVK